MTEKLNEALRTLDPANDEDWTSEGLPKLEPIREAVGDPNLSRAKLSALHPKLSRSTFDEWVSEMDGAEADALEAAENAPETQELEAVRDEVERLEAEVAEWQAAVADAQRELSLRQGALDQALDRRTRLAPKISQADMTKEHIMRQRAAKHAARGDGTPNPMSAIDTQLRGRARSRPTAPVDVHGKHAIGGVQPAGRD